MWISARTNLQQQSFFAFVSVRTIKRHHHHHQGTWDCRGKKKQSGKDSCTSCLMHKTLSCAYTLHKDRVSGVRVVAEKVRWKKLFKGWTALNDIWRGTVGRKMGRKKEHTSELTLVCWSRKGSLGPGNPRYQRSGTVGERYDPSCRIDLQGI